MTQSQGVQDGLSDERLNEILAGLEGVTPGPYNPARDFDFQTDPIASFETTDSYANGGHRIANFFGPDRFANALNTSRLTPETVSSIVTELISLRASKAGEGFQSRVANAHHALFHDDPTDLAERRDRFYEEATETVQSLGMTADEAHQLVEYTFGRAPGDVRKEIGATALTLASLCVIGGWDMMACAEADLAKLQQPATIERIRAKRATRHGRGPLPGISPVPPSKDSGEAGK